MHSRNIAVIVLAAWVGFISACSKQEPPPDYKALEAKLRAELFVATLAQKDKGELKGGDIYMENCAVCHGEDADGGEYEIIFTNRKTGEKHSFKPPKLDAQRPTLHGYTAFLKSMINEGGEYMPPRDNLRNLSESDLKGIEAYIRSASRLKYYHDMAEQLKQK